MNKPVVDFFTGRCRDDRASDTTLSAPRFGLCDDPAPPGSTKTDPAYVATDNEASWLATVLNPAGRLVTFKAVDTCIEILKGNGTTKTSCDGLLLYERTIVFVELKDKKDPSPKWVAKGEDQLKETIREFVDSHGREGKILRAFLCNRQQPTTQQSHTNIINRFAKAMKCRCALWLPLS